MVSKATTAIQQEPPKFPYDWYSPFSVKELGAEEIKSFRFMGNDLIAFWDDENQICVMDAICPHFGAHLSTGCRKDGKVQCSYHHIMFDKQGEAHPGGYYQDVKSLKKFKLGKWCAQVAFGQVWVWHGPDNKKPLRPLPNTLFGLEDYTEVMTSKRHYLKNTNIMFLNENVIDIAHFDTIHRLEFREGPQTLEITRDGFYSNITNMVWSLAGQSKSKLVQKYGQGIRSAFTLCIKMFGPGIALGYGSTELFGLTDFRYVGINYPQDDGGVEIRYAVCVKKRSKSYAQHMKLSKAFNKLPLLKSLPWNHWLDNAVVRMVCYLGWRDLKADLNTWHNRTYISKPKILSEDGPLLDYRKWYLKFWHKDYVHELAEVGSVMDFSGIPQMSDYKPPEKIPMVEVA